MTLIPDGLYRPFFRAESDPREVPVKAFYLDILPVTNEGFLGFVRSNPVWRRSRAVPISRTPCIWPDGPATCASGLTRQPGRPATRVSWFAAKAYARWKGKRLVTVAEWEYAASAQSRPQGRRE